MEVAELTLSEVVSGWFGIFRSPTPDNKERSYSLIIPFKMNGDDLAKNKENNK